MKHFFTEDIKKIYSEERIMLVLMILNILGALALFIFSITTINPNVSVVKIGYGDIGGYRDGSWVDFFAFPLLAIIFGVFHSLIALNVFHKRGAGMAKFFLLITTALIIGTFIVLIRITNEG